MMPETPVTAFSEGCIPFANCAAVAMMTRFRAALAVPPRFLSLSEYPEAEHVRPHRGVRTERYKLIHYHKLPQHPELPEEFELYDLQADPGELHNLYGEPGFATLTKQLLNRIEQLRKETDDHTTDEMT